MTKTATRNENRAGLRLVAPSSLPPIEIEASAPPELDDSALGAYLERGGSPLGTYLAQPAIEEGDPPRTSTRRYLIVLAIIAIWCSLLALAAYSPAK